MLHLNFSSKAGSIKLKKRLKVKLTSIWRIALCIYMLLISMKSHFKSIFKGPVFWAYQRKQLADEGRLLEDRTHTDKFSGSTWSVWSSSTNTTPWALQTTSCASRTVVEQPGFISFPTAPLPRSRARLSVPPEDLVLILLSAGKKRHRKGTPKDHSHLYMLLAFPQQNWDASHLGWSTTDEYIRQIGSDQRSMEPNILPQTGTSSKCSAGA